MAHAVALSFTAPVQLAVWSMQMKYSPLHPLLLIPILCATAKGVNADDSSINGKAALDAGSHPDEPPIPDPSRPVTLGQPLSGPAAQEAKRTDFTGLQQFNGSLIYAWDNARYTAGFKWPWQSHLVLRESHSAVLDSAVFLPTSYQITTPPDSFVYDPQFSPDGKSILFKVGDPTSEFGVYQLMLWRKQTNELRVIAKDLSYRLIYWSPDSRFVAFISGAQQLLGLGGTIRASLHIFDTKTSQERQATPDEPLLGSLAWTSDNALLFSPTVPLAKPSKNLQGIQEEHSPLLPDIWEIAAIGGPPKKLITGGLRPCISPDNKYIAFIGFADPHAPSESDQLNAISATPQAAKPPLPAESMSLMQPSKPKSFFLLLSNRDGSDIRAIRSEPRGLSDLRWTPDGRSLIAVRLSPGGGTAVRVRITRTDMSAIVKNPQAKVEEEAIASFDYMVRPGFDLSEDNRLFRPLQVSHDGHYLFFELLQFEAAPNNGLFLKAVDLRDGSISTLCRIGSVRRLDWRELPQESTK